MKGSVDSNTNYKSLLYEQNGNFIVQKLIQLSGERRKILKIRIEKWGLKNEKDFDKYNDNDESPDFDFFNPFLKELGNLNLYHYKSNEENLKKIENLYCEEDDCNKNNNNNNSSFDKKKIKVKLDYHLLQHNILSLFQNYLVGMSMRIYSNNIVEKCIEHFIGEEKIKLLEELVRGYNYSRLSLFFVFWFFLFF
jgi:hypothetical protein